MVVGGGVCRSTSLYCCGRIADRSHHFGGDRERERDVGEVRVLLSLSKFFQKEKSLLSIKNGGGGTVKEKGIAEGTTLAIRQCYWTTR